MKFPAHIHVTQDRDGNETYFIVHTDGVNGLERDGEPVAEYQLVVEGRVSIVKTFRVRRVRKRRHRDKETP